jgi:hypothetical protein
LELMSAIRLFLGKEGVVDVRDGFESLFGGFTWRPFDGGMSLECGMWVWRVCG